MPSSLLLSGVAASYIVTFHRITSRRNIHSPVLFLASALHSLCLSIHLCRHHHTRLQHYVFEMCIANLHHPLPESSLRHVTCVLLLTQSHKTLPRITRPPPQTAQSDVRPPTSENPRKHYIKRPKHLPLHTHTLSLPQSSHQRDSGHYILQIDFPLSLSLRYKDELLHSSSSHLKYSIPIFQSSVYIYIPIHPSILIPDSQTNAKTQQQAARQKASKSIRG
ncbi:hypothetical protein BS50DRAFT_291831 [Corynespora cassiicola Philippines]|uniref:Uncharacterized protein n=1 Tax=Corynespora cassiicola Philippines TaxID=1448308 RepID=A0A2T2NWZ3_CORCC|nr:hypothetical protein BS50DRAFT_291831 [Corynespora cassiicola Philippines]